MSKPAAHECTCSQQLTEAKNELHKLQDRLRRVDLILHQDDSELSADFEPEENIQRTEKEKGIGRYQPRTLCTSSSMTLTSLMRVRVNLKLGKASISMSITIDSSQKFLMEENWERFTLLAPLHHPKMGCRNDRKTLGSGSHFFRETLQTRKKKVDAQLICDMMRTIYTESPAKLVLVAGDSDYSISLTEARERNWEVETWFWSKGMSNDFKSWSFLSLEPHHKSFVYITGPTTDKPTLEIRGEIIKSWKWRDEQIMECFHACASDLLCQFHWVNDTTAHLYFDTKAQLKHAKVSISNKYPDKLDVLIKRPERDNRRGSRGRNPSRNANSRDWNRSNRSSNLQIDSEATNRSSTSEESIIEKSETETENH